MAGFGFKTDIVGYNVWQEEGNDHEEEGGDGVLVQQDWGIIER